MDIVYGSVPGLRGGQKTPRSTGNDVNNNAFLEFEKEKRVFPGKGRLCPLFFGM